jgi:hypothetical protein
LDRRKVLHLHITTDVAFRTWPDMVWATLLVLFLVLTKDHLVLHHGPNRHETAGTDGNTREMAA